MFAKPLPPPLPGAVIEPRTAPKIRPLSAPRPKGKIWPPTGLDTQSALGKFEVGSRESVQKSQPAVKEEDVHVSRITGSENVLAKQRPSSACASQRPSSASGNREQKATAEPAKILVRPRPQSAPTRRFSSTAPAAKLDNWEREVAGLNSLELAEKHPAVLSNARGVKKMPMTGVDSMLFGHPSRMKAIQERDIRRLFFTTTFHDPQFTGFMAPPPKSFKDIHMPTAKAMKEAQKELQRQAALSASHPLLELAGSSLHPGKKSDLSIRTSSVPPEGAPHDAP